MLSDKWIHSTIREMQVADSIRYREAVTRLKRLLYDSHYKIEPSTMKSQNERRNYAQKLTEECEKEDDNAINQDLETSTNSGILGMVKQQDELITQLEKENNFLKAEMASTIEVSKEITLQNEEFRKRLTDTLAQMELSPDVSLLSEGQDKVQEILNCLKDEREHLMEGLKLQEETIATLRKREIAALDKVKEAIELAEDSHKISEKVRSSSESSHSELKSQVQILHDQLLTTQKQLKRAKDREKENDKIILDQERHLLILENEKKKLDKITSKQEMELAKKVRELDTKIREAESDKQRLQKLLSDQKKTSETTLKRLEALLDRRNHEAETFMARRSSLEKQIRDAKDENMRLIEAVNELAKDRGQKTDDDKYAKQLSEIPYRTQDELNEIKTTVKNHQDSIVSLQDAVVSVREEMTRGMDDLRENLEELCTTIKEGKVDTKDSAEASFKIDADVPKNNAVSNEQLPHSSRSEGYESLSESTHPSLKLVERRAKTEHMEDPSSSNVFDHSFSKIIVPLPRKVVQSGAAIKTKKNILEPKDIDEAELKDVTEERELITKSSTKVKVENEDNNQAKIGSLEVVKENETEEDEEVKNDDADTTKSDESEVSKEQNEKDVIVDEVEKIVSLKNEAPEIELAKRLEENNGEMENKLDDEEPIQQTEDNASHNEIIKEDIAIKSEETLEITQSEEQNVEEKGIDSQLASSNLSTDAELLHRETEDESGDSFAKDDNSVTDPNLDSAALRSNKDNLAVERKESLSNDNINEDSQKLETAEDKMSNDASAVEIVKDEENGKTMDEPVDDISIERPNRTAAIYKSTIDNQFENMDELENIQNEFETVEEDVNTSEEGSLNGKDVLSEKEDQKQEPDDVKAAVEEVNRESDQKIQDDLALVETKDTTADVENLSATNVPEPVVLPDEN